MEDKYGNIEMDMEKWRQDLLSDDEFGHFIEF